MRLLSTPSTIGASRANSDEIDPLPWPVKRPKALARLESVLPPGASP